MNLEEPLYANDAARKLERGREKLKAALQRHKPILMVGGLVGDVPLLAKVAVENGLAIIEPSHPALVLSQGLLQGVTNLHQAEAVRWKVPTQVILRIVRGMRNMVALMSPVVNPISCSGPL